MRTVLSGEVKLVTCGEGKGRILPIEAEYLEPEVHSLMEISRFSVGPDDCSKSVALLPSIGRLRKYASKYVEWGESQGFHKNPTSQARETSERHWYDVTYLPRADIILPKIQQYRLATFLNSNRLHQNSSLLGLYDFLGEKIIACTAILNSTVSILSRLQYARILGNEGNIQLDVYSAKMMIVPNILALGRLGKVEAAFKKMLLRPMLSFIPEQRMRRMAFENAGKESQLAALSNICELDMPDRRELDHAVLELLGMKSEKERTEWINQLYDYLRGFFEQVRGKEEQAIVNKNTTSRKGAATPQDVASQVWREISENEGHWLRPYREFVWDIIGRGPEFDVRDLPPDGEARVHEDMTGIGVMFVKGRKHIALVPAPTLAEARLLVLIANEGMRGPVKVPRTEEEIQGVIEHFGVFARERDAHVRELIAERSSDEDLQMKVYELVIGRLRQHSN